MPQLIVSGSAPSIALTAQSLPESGGYEVDARHIFVESSQLFILVLRIIRAGCRPQAAIVSTKLARCRTVKKRRIIRSSYADNPPGAQRIARRLRIAPISCPSLPI
ncbi:hypothetical protein ACQK5W_14840 [Pantoea sp. FN060301]|uniref:hypothetical protein n=1 Tax=Pantoea sp. FN060301 TaxID=3420380 RepID=UPI003D166184